MDYEKVQFSNKSGFQTSGFWTFIIFKRLLVRLFKSKGKKYFERQRKELKLSLEINRLTDEQEQETKRKNPFE